MELSSKSSDYPIKLGGNRREADGAILMIFPVFFLSTVPDRKSVEKSTELYRRYSCPVGRGVAQRAVGRGCAAGAVSPKATERGRAPRARSPKARKQKMEHNYIETLKITLSRRGS